MVRSIAHVIETTSPQPGQVSCLIPGLCEYQRSKGWDVRLLSRENFDEAGSILGTVNLAHIHGVFSPVARRVWPVLKECRPPYLVSTYGMLAPRPHRGGWWRRVWAALSYQDAMLKGAWCLHALSSAESDALRRSGFKRRIKVMPMGVSRENPDSKPSVEFDIDAPHQRLVVYMGPLHPSEGIVPFLKACAMLGDEYEDFHLVLACGEKTVWQETIQASIRRQGFESRVTVVNAPALDKLKAMLLACQLVVVPTPGECCAVSALQALALGRPVLISPGCNLAEVQLRGAGLEVAPKREALCKALRTLLTKDPQDLRAMGRVGPQIVQERYAWERLGPEYLNLYARVLGLH